MTVMSNNWQEMVRDFHRKFELPDGSSPFGRPSLRASLILEEAFETATKGLGCRVYLLDEDGRETDIDFSELRFQQVNPVDEVETMDGLCDEIYVALGCAVEMNYDLEPAFQEVHRSNMEKVGGAKRADGKILKPEGWKAPDISAILESQRETINKA
jgi:predicted HAD superfamily Cof-like phosphohydrolase